jgi:CheY-like chemotaxis protein
MTRILIVEDEALVAMLFESMLEELGYAVVGPALTLDRARALATEAQLDYAILGKNLGQGVLSTPVALALAARGIPFLYATGCGSKGVSEPFDKAPILKKPFLTSDLDQAMQQLVAPDARPTA